MELVSRYVTKDKVIEAQSAALSGAEIDAAIAKVAASLPSLKPAAVEKTEQVVPGSPTALKLAAEPASAPAATPPAQPATPPAPPAKP